MSVLPYAMFDADNHYYEPDDCFTRHIEAKYARRTLWIDRRGGAGVPGRMFVGDERCHFFSVGAGDSVGPPGAMKEFLRGVSDQGGSPSLHPIDGLAVPEFTLRKARLAKLDEQNVEACLMLPTTGVGVEPQLREPRHREALYPSLRAFNRWLEEDWGFGGRRSHLRRAAVLARRPRRGDPRARSPARSRRALRDPQRRPDRRPLARGSRASIHSGRAARKRASTSSTTSGARPSARSTTCPGDCDRTRPRTATR